MAAIEVVVKLVVAGVATPEAVEAGSTSAEASKTATLPPARFARSGFLCHAMRQFPSHIMLRPIAVPKAQILIQVWIDIHPSRARIAAKAGKTCRLT